MPSRRRAGPPLGPPAALRPFRFKEEVEEHVRRVPARWATRFGSFVAEVTVPTLLRALNSAGCPTTEKTVYDWLAGRATPRTFTALEIARVSNGRVTVGDICRHRIEVRDGAGSGGDGPGPVAGGT